MKNEVRKLDYGDRRRIQDMLDARERLADIAWEVMADPTSISREIKRNRTSLGKVAKSRLGIVTCDRFEGCEVRGPCGSWCPSRCRSCSDVRCEATYASFREFACHTTERFPHVRDGRGLLNHCPKKRYAYRARDAHRMATERLRESRRGIDLDLASATAVAEVVGPLLARGQSVSAILSSHPELGMSPTIPCRHMDLGLIAGAMSLSLPRKVRLKKRSRRSSAPPDRQRRDLAGRDYAAFLLLAPEVRALFKETGTVIGRPGGKCLLTFCMRENEIFYAQARALEGSRQRPRRPGRHRDGHRGRRRRRRARADARPHRPRPRVRPLRGHRHGEELLRAAPRREEARGLLLRPVLLLAEAARGERPRCSGGSSPRGRPSTG